MKYLTLMKLCISGKGSEGLGSDWRQSVCSIVSSIISTKGAAHRGTMCPFVCLRSEADFYTFY